MFTVQIPLYIPGKGAIVMAVFVGFLIESDLAILAFWKGHTMLGEKLLEHCSRQRSRNVLENALARHGPKFAPAASKI
jgi:hypothetical protein